MTTIRSGVIGHPIGHSKSPLIHTHWIAQYGLDGTYEALDIAPDELPKQVAELIVQGYAGFNVTLPHKQAMFRLCHSVDETAQAIGAVNTVRIVDGRLEGSNTDAFGFIANIKQNAPNVDFTRGPAVVLGAGGAARAVVHGLLQENVPHIIATNRTQDKADALRIMAQDRISVVHWDDRNDALDGANLIVNTTALGMKGQEPLKLSLHKAPVDAVVTDIVYNPLMTELLRAAQLQGNPIVSGIGMLLHQARPGFYLWHGVMPEVTPELERKVLA